MTLALFSALGLFVAMDFEGAFWVFHGLFFPGKENWLFDPELDEIINALPQEFFLSCAVCIGAAVLLISASLLISGVMARERENVVPCKREWLMPRRNNGMWRVHATKRMLIGCLAMLLALALCACKASPLTEQHEKDVTSASLERLMSAMPVTVDQARQTLELLETLGYMGEVLFAFDATDDDQRTYYHLWVGERTVDVYLQDDGEVAAVVRSGILLYQSDEPMPLNVEQPVELSSEVTRLADPEASPTDEPVEATLTLEGLTQQVGAGD